MKHLDSFMLALAKKYLWLPLGYCLFVAASFAAERQSTPVVEQADAYFLQAGDVIELLVWKEPDLSREILIGPDGFISIPLIGAVDAKNKTLDELRLEIKKRLSAVVNEPSVNISLRSVAGNKIFILGKVARPGEYPLTQPVDVLQALSKAGGITPFADASDIKIIRRTGQNQAVIPFNYSQVERGKHLEQNVTLASGDTILVP
jgi:polysaccharide export outer membrane protein